MGHVLDGWRDKEGVILIKKYNGQFKGAKFDGEGILVLSNGTSVEGIFKAGKPIDLSVLPSEKLPT